TYSMTKSMQLTSTGGFTDPLTRESDRSRGLDSLHNLRMNGTIELPIGPNKLLFGGASGWLGRVIEHWQTRFILDMATGQRSSITRHAVHQHSSGSRITGLSVHSQRARYEGYRRNIRFFLIARRNISGECIDQSHAWRDRNAWSAHAGLLGTVLPRCQR